jgi:hypothetical protein
MKSLLQSLVDYDMAQLEAIADSRAVALNTSQRSQAMALLTEALVSPAGVAIALAALPDEAVAALQRLLQNGGQLEGPRFTRQFGVVRSMGPARLAREKPWQNPASITERLWYAGFIFSAFQMTNQGSLEIFYIPQDLQPLLAAALGPPARKPAVPADTVIAPVPRPAVEASGQNRLRENIFSLLVYLQTTPVRLSNKEGLAPPDKAALAGCLLPPLPGINFVDEVGFLLHLAQRAGLLAISHGRLRPDPDAARMWLQGPAGKQTRQLQEAWRGDPAWNDLWHTPGLVMQPTGWENSPLLARSKILGYLAQLPTGPDHWFALADLVAWIKEIDPDFQRPGGDYQSWYISNAHGQSLMGFEHWEQVEGALIRYVVGGLLPLLGVVNLGLDAAGDMPAFVQLTAEGAAFLANQPPDSPGDAGPQFLHVDNKFGVHVLPEVSLYDRFQLARFATLEERQTNRVVYRITQASVGRALRNGVTAGQMAAFLTRATNNQTPLTVLEALHQWGQRRDTVKFERVTLLRVSDPQILAELRGQPVLAPLLGEALGAGAIVAPADKVSEIRRILIELGYME